MYCKSNSDRLFTYIRYPVELGLVFIYVLENNKGNSYYSIINFYLLTNHFFFPVRDNFAKKNIDLWAYNVTSGALVDGSHDEVK